jgi:hypothetical protein
MAKSSKSKPSGKTLSVDASELAGSMPEDMVGKLDQNRIKQAQKALDESREKLKTKVYAVQFDSAEDIDAFQSFMENDAEWKEKEALGVMEICKILSDLKKKGVKENILYMTALPLEASHYFLSKSSGRGLEQARKFISLLKPLESSLQLAKADAQEYQDLEKELAAAQQGIALA